MEFQNVNFQISNYNRDYLHRDMMMIPVLIRVENKHMELSFITRFNIHDTTKMLIKIKICYSFPPLDLNECQFPDSTASIFNLHSNVSRAFVLYPTLNTIQSF